MKKVLCAVILIVMCAMPLSVIAADIPARKVQLDWLIYGAGGNDNLGRINAAGDAVPRNASVTGQFSYHFTSRDGRVSGRVEGDNGEIHIFGRGGTSDAAAYEFASQFTQHFATMTRAGHDHLYAPLPYNLGGLAPERFPVDFQPRDGDAANTAAANNVRVRDREYHEFIIFFYDSREEGGMMNAMWTNGVTKYVYDLMAATNRPVAHGMPAGGIRLIIGYRNFTVGGVEHRSDAVPFISVDGRTMVPLRIVAEGLGAEVEWDGDTRTVTVLSDGETLRLPVGVPLPDGMGTPVIVNDYTFVPVRYISEKLGADVSWNELAQAVYISR
ncbi:MAG: copper amine oxidase N-terminal domain-containing protein [Defluviitaleaceae bacterium]|nr:copper amine oxidase N-terminal domain-containing protein [Defluviitaleaceae bacterium]MCL2263240.1 copper amine oxidase N-terminal domain-containing protein [Defluviitaleaceae bacterium]